MTVKTAIYEIQTPEDSDVPNGPAQMKTMADKIDATQWTSRSLKPTTGIVTCNGTLALTGAYQDVPGMKIEITPSVASILLVTAVFDLSVVFGESLGGVNGEAVGTLKLDSETEDPHLAVQKYKQTAGLTGEQEQRGTVSQVYRFALSAAAHTIKARARWVTATSGFVVVENSRLMYHLHAS